MDQHTDAKGKSRRLVYGEDGRHVYGGHVSPDGKYVLFTGNMEEDGDPSNSGAPMGLMRVADAPIIGGESKELRQLHPNVNHGPVLVLPKKQRAVKTLLVDLLRRDAQQIHERALGVKKFSDVQFARWLAEAAENQDESHQRPREFFLSGRDRAVEKILQPQLYDELRHPADPALGQREPLAGRPA